VSGAIRERVRVFISAKSSDYEYAAQVYRRLGDAGVAAFFSRESLPAVGSSDYRREIDRALDEADHMIVVTSSVDHVLASWVEAEWGFFINEKRSGRKRGNLVTVVVGALGPTDLPPSLRYFEVIPFDPEALDRILRYVQEPSPVRTVPAAAPHPTGPRAAFSETATFGGPPGAHLMKALPARHVLATGGLDGAVRLYDVNTRVRRSVLRSSQYWTARHEALITALDISPDGQRLASGHLDGSVHLWELGEPKEVEVAMKHDLAVSGLLFSTDGQTLTAASKDGVIKFWDVTALQEARARHGAQRLPAPVVSLASVPARGWLVAGLINTATRRYVIQIQKADGTHRVVATLGVPESFTILALSDDGRVLAAGGRDGTVRIYDFDAVAQALAQRKNPKSLPPLLDLQGHKKPVSSVAFFPDGRRLATCATDNTVTVWDLTTGQPSSRLQGPESESFVSAAVLGDGTLAAALADGRVRLWEER